MKRIVITGMGAISPLGLGLSENWNNLINGKSGIRSINYTNNSCEKSYIAGIIPFDETRNKEKFDALVSKKESKKNDPFIQYVLYAAAEAINQSGWIPRNDQDREHTGVVIGSAIGGLKTLTEGQEILSSKGEEGLSPFFIPAQLINMASGQLAIKYGYWGPDFSVVGACSTGAEAIATGARAILLNEAEVMVVGGADAAVHPLTIAGFEMMHALATGFDHSPTEASRPFDKDRKGFVLGEGAGVLVLEEYNHAKRRGASILAELCGYASVSDGFHIAASHPEGIGEQRALQRSIERAKISPSDLGYINAHATGTLVGDRGEIHAIKQVFGSDIYKTAISSTKSATGHTFGAAGALEAIYSICTLRSGVLPPTLNLHNPDKGNEGINLVPLISKEKDLSYVLSNSFGFGATKVALIFGKQAC